MKKIRGIVPALLTPFDTEGQVDEKETRKLIRYLIDKGSSGFFTTGSTGEGLLLSLQERKQVCEIAVSECSGEVPVIAHVGALSTNDAVELAAHARTAGAAAVGSITPIYYGYGIKDIVEYYTKIGQASDLPVYVYYIPMRTGASLSLSDYLEEISAIPNLAGIKYSDNNLYLLQKIVAEIGDKLNILSGFDEILSAALMMGAHGGIGSNYNILPELFLGVYDAIQTSNIPQARDKQFRINSYVDIMLEYGGLPMLKHTMGYRGIECGDCRPPLHALTDKEKDAIDAKITKLGFFDWPEMNAALPLKS